MLILFFVVYGLLFLVSATNLALMHRPRKNLQTSDKAKVTALIPARNEQATLPLLIPQLLQEVERVYVYDDQSTDDTANIARSMGVTVIAGGELPAGWIGKNHACHQLALVASEDSPSDWYLFLDADTRVKPGFGQALTETIAAQGRRCPVITGFGQFFPGKGLEPLYLLWVPFILLATIPFGVISRSKMGHPQFTNGQFTLWRATKYIELLPHKNLGHAILEDVRIGRWLAKMKVPVEVALFTPYFGVQMYRNTAEAISGMAKNSSEIAGSLGKSVLFALLLGLLGIGVVIEPRSGPMLFLAALCVAIMLRSFYWPILFTPLSLIAGALTVLVSALSPRTTRTWKGRTYSLESTDE